MKIIICDDEPVIAEKLDEKVSSFLRSKEIDVNAKIYFDGRDAMNSTELYDMAFLDIEMGEANGIDVAQWLKRLNPNVIIFIITSYNKYLDNAMDLSVFRYITKPLDEERLERSLEKALSIFESRTIEFFVKHKKLVRINTDEILSVEISGHGTLINTVSEIYKSNESIRFWKAKLPSSSFASPHNSYIVNLRFITDYKSNEIMIDNRYIVPVAYRKRAEFKKTFMNYITKRD